MALLSISSSKWLILNQMSFLFLLVTDYISQLPLLPNIANWVNPREWTANGGVMIASSGIDSKHSLAHLFPIYSVPKT